MNLKLLKKINFENLFPFYPIIKSYKENIIYFVLALNKIYRISVKTWEISSIDLLQDNNNIIGNTSLYFHENYLVNFSNNNNSPTLFNLLISDEPFKFHYILYDIDFDSEIISYKCRFLPFRYISITSFIS